MALLLRIALAALALAWGVAATPAVAKGPDAPLRIPLEPFGYQAVANRYLLEGATMLTVHYVDAQHLLVTFGISKLMMRLVECPVDDQDRMVHAVLVELPSGKELAHTEWRFHDLAQYLWDLGDGHFLLRQRDVLTTISPLQNLTSGDAFHEEAFLRFDRRIDSISVSANHDLLTIETVKRKPPGLEPGPAVQQVAAQQPGATQPVSLPGTPVLKKRPLPEAKPESAPVEVVFLRLKHALGSSEAPFAKEHGDTSPDISRPSKIVATLDGRVRTSKLTAFPLTSEGVLEVKKATSDGVDLDFLTFTGKVIKLGDFATSCPLRPTFVSPSEFVVFGCRGADEAIDLAGFNLHGDLIWQINFSDLQAYPSITSAVPAGRFAFSRTITTSNVFGSETPSASQLTAQEVRVIQTYNGRQLLRVVTSPMQPSGQNYALSPDGLNIAVIHDAPSIHGTEVTHNTAIEIYKLPPLSGRDQAELKTEASFAPEPANAHIRFSVQEIKEELAAKPAFEDSNEDALQPDVPKDAAPEQKAQAPAAPATRAIPVADAPASESTLGDAEPGHRRKPPTLYEPAPPSSTTPPQ